MKLLIAALTALIATNANAKEVPVLPGAEPRNYTADKDVWIPKSLKEQNVYIATWQERNQEIVMESVCVGANASWQECSERALKSFASICINEKIEMYCKGYKALENKIDEVAMPERKKEWEEYRQSRKSVENKGAN